MKYQLPQTNEKGFTLVELLVVISIIAILAVVGLTIFSNTQRNARDARRRADIDAIANALEVNKTMNTALYNTLTSSQFAASAIPVDSGNTAGTTYCVATAVAAGAPPANAAFWGGACPGSYATVSSTAPAATAGSWTVCAALEGGTSQVYCRSSSQ